VQFFPCCHTYLNSSLPSSKKGNWNCPSLRSCSHFWHQMNQSNENLSIPQGVLTKKLHNLPKSHSNSFFATTFCGWGTSPNKMSSQESNHGGNEVLNVIYLKLFHVSWVVVHLIKQCSNVSSKPITKNTHAFLPNPSAPCPEALLPLWTKSWLKSSLGATSAPLFGRFYPFLFVCNPSP
jgi:hypothetical protein